MAPQFQVGERVRARASQISIRAGMLGTVREVYFLSDTLYLVQFDDLRQLKLVTELMLEGIDESDSQE